MSTFALVLRLQLDLVILSESPQGFAARLPEPRNACPSSLRHGWGIDKSFVVWMSGGHAVPCLLLFCSCLGSSMTDRHCNHAHVTSRQENVAFAVALARFIPT